MSNKPFAQRSLYPWIVWTLSASFFYYKYLIQVSPGVMSSQLMRAYSLTGAGLGNLAACFFYGYLVMQIPAGLLLDKWSPKKVTSVAAGLCGFSVFLFANSHSLLEAGVSRFIIGLSASFAAVSCFKLGSIWFPPKRFAFIAGLSMTAAMLGAIGGQGPLSFFVITYGWRHALELVSLAGLLLALLIGICIRDQAKPSNAPIPNDETNVFTKLAILLKHKQTWFLSFYSGLAFAPVSVFGGLWGVSFIEKAYSFSPPLAANYLSLIFVGFAIGCPLTGWFSDYTGRRKPIMITGTLLAMVSITAVVYLPLSNLSLSLLLFLFGLGASCFFLCFSMVRELHSLIFTGTVLGFMNTFDALCEAITEPFIGKLLDLQWAGTYEHGARSFSVHEYQVSLLALTIYFGIALFLLLFIEETYCKQKI